jgi:hypothetical protein
MVLIAFTLPSLRTEGIRILEVLIIKMAANREVSQDCAFGDGNLANITILLGGSGKYSRRWSIDP